MTLRKRPSDAWGIAFALIHQARHETMTRTRLALTAIASGTLLLVVAEGVVTWPL